MDRDLTGSRAILIGNSTYRDPAIPDIPGASLGVQAMSDLLTGELCGWPADRIQELVNVASPPELARGILAAIEDVESAGVLLLYYVGHGQRTTYGQLALTVGDTDLAPRALPHTAILYDAIADILRGCQAATKLVILDCCHAELGTKANYQFLSADLADAYPVDGLYFIGASRTNEKAKASLAPGLTYFTRAFIDVVQTGIPGKPPVLRLDQIFAELRSRMLRADLPEPVESGIRGAHQIPFARNAAPPQTHVDLEEELRRMKERLAELEPERHIPTSSADELTDTSESHGRSPGEADLQPEALASVKPDVTTQGDADEVGALLVITGYEFYDAGDDYHALEAFDDAIGAGHPDWVPAAYVGLGYVLSDQGHDIDLAEQAFEKAMLSGHPVWAPAAEEAWDYLQGTRGGDWGPAARMGLGDALREHGDLDGAQAAYQQAIDSGHAEWAPAAMVRLGALLGDEGHDGSQLDTGGARSNAPTAARVAAAGTETEQPDP